MNFSIPLALINRGLQIQTILLSLLYSNAIIQMFKYYSKTFSFLFSLNTRQCNNAKYLPVKNSLVLIPDFRLKYYCH